MSKVEKTIEPIVKTNQLIIWPASNVSQLEPTWSVFSAQDRGSRDNILAMVLFFWVSSQAIGRCQGHWTELVTTVSPTWPHPKMMWVYVGKVRKSYCLLVSARSFWTKRLMSTTAILILRDHLKFTAPEAWSCFAMDKEIWRSPSSSMFWRNGLHWCKIPQTSPRCDLFLWIFKISETR